MQVLKPLATVWKHLAICHEFKQYGEYDLSHTVLLCRLMQVFSFATLFNQWLYISWGASLFQWTCTRNTKVRLVALVYETFCFRWSTGTMHLCLWQTARSTGVSMIVFVGELTYSDEFQRLLAAIWVIFPEGWIESLMRLHKLSLSIGKLVTAQTHSLFAPLHLWAGLSRHSGQNTGRFSANHSRYMCKMGSRWQQ